MRSSLITPTPIAPTSRLHITAGAWTAETFVLITGPLAPVRFPWDECLQSWQSRSCFEMSRPNCQRLIVHEREASLLPWPWSAWTSLWCLLCLSVATCSQCYDVTCESWRCAEVFPEHERLQSWYHPLAMIGLHRWVENCGCAICS